MKKVLTELQDLLIKELEKITEKKDINPTELDHVKKAMCTIKDIEEVMAMADYVDGYSDRGSYGRMMSGRHYDVRMNGSYARGRDYDTGRYISRRGEEDGYSGHSIKDRMISKLEGMYDEAGSEHEKQVIDQWIGRLETE